VGGAGRGGFAGRGRAVRPLGFPGSLPFGDIITQINGEPIHNSADLFNVLNKSNPGDTVDVTLWSNGATRHVQVQTQ
jgi:S1-C subfamily serine protease